MKNKIVVVCGEHKHEVDVTPGQKITIWKLGSESKGWIPSKKHFDNFKEQLVKALIDVECGRDGHIVFHFGVKTEQVKI